MKTAAAALPEGTAAIVHLASALPQGGDIADTANRARDNPAQRARAFADAWGSRFVEIGAAGHINGDSGFGEWPEGEQMLIDFCAEVAK